jgi:hypothetical protein
VYDTHVLRVAACLLLVGCASVSGLNDFTSGDQGSGGTGAFGGGNAGGGNAGGGATGGAAAGGEGGSAPSCQVPDAVWDPVGQGCFLLVTEGKTWDDAQADCQSTFGGHLAVLATVAEYDSVLDGLPPLPGVTWIGGNDRVTEGTFAWVTDEPFTYANMTYPWEAGEPNAVDEFEDCIDLRFDPRMMNDSHCDSTNPYICEFAP